MSRPIDRVICRIPNLFPALLVLISLGVLPSSHHALETVRAFSILLVTPVLMPLCGLLSQKLASGGRRLFRLSVGMVVLYCAMSVLTFWAKAAGKGQAFQIFTHVGAPWFFLVAAQCHMLANGLEWLSLRTGWKKRVLYPIIVALSVLSGYIPLYRDILCSGRLTLCLPLFLIGRWMDPYALSMSLKNNRRLKPMGVGLLVLLLGLCWWKTGLILSLSNALLGTVRYAKPEAWGYGVLGGVVRLVQILGGGFVTLCLLSLTPDQKIPVLSHMGRRFYVGYFFHAPVIYLLSAWMNNGSLVIDLLRMALIVLLPLLLSTSTFQYPVRRFAMAITALLMDGDDRSREGNPAPAFWFFCLAFGMLASMYVSVLVSKGKTFIWRPDGEDLYVTIMYYTRDYILGVLNTLFTTGQFVLPQFDFSIGQGAGVLSVLHVNPFFLLAILFPKSMLEQVYGFYAIGQLFIAALAFRYFVSYLGIRKDLPVWLGALTYAFSGFCIFTAGKHIYFITYMVIGLPLLLAGCERWLQQRKWGLFVSVVVFLFLGGYYYTWMDSILMAIYLIVREIHLYRPNIKKMLADCFQLLGLYLWGFGMSMVLVLPAMSNLFSSSRAPDAGNTETRLLVNGYFAQRVLQCLFSVLPDGSNWTRLGLIGLMLTAFVVLFLRIRKREWAQLRILVVLLGLFLFIPIMGSIFNGFGYTTNRWCYGISLLCAVIFAVVFPHLHTLSEKEKSVSIIMTLLYCAATLHFNPGQETRFSVVMLVGATAAVLVANRLPSKKQAESLLALVTVFALLVNCGYFYKAFDGENADAYLKNGKGLEKYTASPEAAATDLEDELYRVELPANRNNTFCLTGGNGTSTYWSVLDGTEVNYYLDFELDSVRQVYSLWGLDERADLCAIASVKYYVGSNEAQVPYGFTEYREDFASGKTIYQNQYALPFGYTYTSFISREDYDDLTPIQRQQALLQGAVIETENEGTVAQSLDQIYPSLNERKVAWELTETDGVELENGSTFHATQRDATATLTIHGYPDCETYLCMKGLRFEGRGGEASLMVSDGQMSKKGKLYQAGGLYAFQRAGTTWNVGYHETPLTTIELKFENTGYYMVDDISVYCLPMSDYTAQVTQLGENTLQNVRETLNGGLTGSIELNETRLLAFSVPYSVGWELLVNGQPASLMRVNGMYLGTILNPGKYEVELVYHAPGIIPGAAISGVSFVALFAYGIFFWMKKHSVSSVAAKEQGLGNRQ